MARLTDPDRLQAYLDALNNWSFAEYIQFELSEQAYEWLRREIPGCTLGEIKRLMYEYVNAGGEIDETRETRSNWANRYPFHYDLRFEIQGRNVYIETRLNYRLPIVVDASSILVVNIHER